MPDACGRLVSEGGAGLYALHAIDEALMILIDVRHLSVPRKVLLAAGTVQSYRRPIADIGGHEIEPFVEQAVIEKPSFAVQEVFNLRPHIGEGPDFGVALCVHDVISSRQRA